LKEGEVSEVRVDLVKSPRRNNNWRRRRRRRRRRSWV
jgi:hypothetical protein